MAGYGYSYVTDKGFVAFGHELEGGEWKAVSIKKIDQEDGMARGSLADTPSVVLWKVRALWGIRVLAEATSEDRLGELDVEWDSSQRAFHLGVGAAAEHPEGKVREAAGRVRTALLSGGGTAQTLLSYDQEVDYGLNQVELAGKKPLAGDVALIGAEGPLKRIEKATLALAKGLGRETGKARSPSRGRRIRDALSACSTAFNGIHETIAWAIEHTPDMEERARLQALLAPFERLVERYPPPAGAPAAPAAPGEEPAALPADPS